VSHSKSRAMTREEILAVYAQGPEAVVALVTRLLERIAALEGLEARLRAMEAQLAKDSHNSAQPPSADVRRDPPRRPRSLRGPSGKRPGGQPGHDGTTLTLRARPDVITTHAPTHCDACGRGLPVTPQALRDISSERRQVFDLTRPQLLVTEHRVLDQQCRACGAWTRARFPEGVSATVQYGPELRALAVYLTTQQLLPVARATELLSHFAGQPLSVATVVAAEQHAVAAVAPIVAAIHAGLCRAPVIGVDETNLFVAGHSWWLHTESTPTLTHYTMLPYRGRAAYDAIGLLPHFHGTAVHDGCQAFGTAPAPAPYPCQHALCGVHLLRDLTFLAEEYALPWAAQLKQLLLTMKAAVAQAKAAGQSALARATRARYRRRYHALIAAGEAGEPPPAHRPGATRGKLSRTPAARLLLRLRRDEAWVLRFLEDFAVPFDNNEAERDLRMMKVEQKISGGFRTPRGAETFAMLRSYLATARKQGCAALDALRALFAGHPFMPALPE
jgi:transposase